MTMGDNLTAGALCGRCSTWVAAGAPHACPNAPEQPAPVERPPSPEERTAAALERIAAVLEPLLYPRYVLKDENVDPEKP